MVKAITIGSRVLDWCVIFVASDNSSMLDEDAASPVAVADVDGAGEDMTSALK